MTLWSVFPNTLVLVNAMSFEPGNGQLVRMQPLYRVVLSGCEVLRITID
jgi:hypothetical protein